MQKKDTTLIYGVCLDCGKVFVKRPMHGIEQMCSHCGSFDIVARRIVKGEE